MERVYLDTAPVIYTIEQSPDYAAAVDRRLSAAGIVRIPSDLTRLECRVQPIRDNNPELLKDYDDYFWEAVAEVVTLSSEVMDRATAIRAQYGLKTADAIHLAAAVAAGCDVFLTNDHRLDRFPDITIEVVHLQPPPEA
jgi:predicted nucleic acid-binding protein